MKQAWVCLGERNQSPSQRSILIYKRWMPNVPHDCLGGRRLPVYWTTVNMEEKWLLFPLISISSSPSVPSPCVIPSHLYHTASGHLWSQKKREKQHTHTHKGKQVIWLMLGVCFNLEECYFTSVSPLWSVCAVESAALPLWKQGGRQNVDQYPRNTPETFYFIKHFPIKAAARAL